MFSYVGSLYILDINHFSDILFAVVSSHSVVLIGMYLLLLKKFLSFFLYWLPQGIWSSWPGIRSKLQLWPKPQLQQHWILNLLRWAGTWTCVSVLTRDWWSHCTTAGVPTYYYYFVNYFSGCFIVLLLLSSTVICEVVFGLFLFLPVYQRF